MYVATICYFDADFTFTHRQTMICPGREIPAVREYVTANYKPDVLESEDKYFVATLENLDPVMGVL